MRRITLLFLSLCAFLVPAAALAARETPGDGTLVVRNGEANYVVGDLSSSTPVVRLRITGSVIGQVTGQGRIIIDPGAKSPQPEVTGAVGHDVAQSDTARSYTGGADGFKFRAVGGTFVIVVYGAKVNLVAVGTGSVQLAGLTDATGDGWYSLNANDRKSLPGTPTGKLTIGDTSIG
jgi:hypothetical protein